MKKDRIQDSEVSSQNKHTPGPWEATKDVSIRGNPAWRIDSDEISLIACLEYINEPERDKGESTAKLIASAPEMLEVLQSLVQWDNDFPVGEDTGSGLKELDRIIEQAKAIIIKAGE